MRKTKASSLLIAGLLALAPFAARAGYADTNTVLCVGSSVQTVGSALDAVASAILAGNFTNQRDRDNLLSKLSTANTKTLSSKWSDASGKLEDISNAATTLAGATKPKLNSADAINAAVLAAQACIARPE